MMMELEGELALKEQDKYFNKKIWEAVTSKKEIAFLNFYHLYYFQKPLENFYLNYALDAFSEYEILYSSKNKAKFKSIKVTIDEMILDFLMKKIMSEFKNNRKGIDKKI